MSKIKKRKLGIIIGLVLVAVLLLGVVGGVTYAIVSGTRTSTQHGFKVSVRGAVNVKADVVGKSYLNAENKETINIISFDGTQEQTLEREQNFENDMYIDSARDVVSYVFEITNKTEEAKYTDLIIEPVYSLTEARNVIATMYYSIPDGDYVALADRFIVAHQDETVLVKLEIEITEVDEDLTLDGDFTFNLHTEDGMPVDFEYDKTYRTEGDKAYYTEKCPTCGATHGVEKEMKAGTYLIVNDDPTSDNYAQKILDTNVNGKTIVFAPGTYGDLIFRPTSATVESVYLYDLTNKTITGEEITDLETLAEENHYLYNRTLEDITLAGTEGAVFEGLVTVQSAHFGRDTFVRADRIGATADIQSLDPIKGTAVSYGTNTPGYVSNIEIDGFTIQDMKFTGKYGRIYIYGNGAGMTANFKNITIKNCRFETEEAYVVQISASEERGFAAVYVSMNANATYDTKLIDNVRIENNYSDGHYQSYHVYNTKNTFINNNVSMNTPHNGISIQSGYGMTTEGIVEVKNNTVNKAGVGIATGERGVRFGAVKNGSIVIANNKFFDCVEDRTEGGQGIQLLATQTLTNTTYTFVNNKYDNVAMKDIKGNGDKFILYIQEP